MKRSTWIILGVIAGIIILTASTQTGREIVSEVIRKLSNTGLNLIKRFEGLRLQVYQDEAGNWTIGYGHLVKPGESYYPYGPITSITTDQAETLLEQDTADAQNAVNTYVTVPLNQNQFDALTSFVYNIGSGAFSNSTLLQYLNNGDYQNAADQLDQWVNAGGQRSSILVSRREQEKQIFLS